MSAPSRGPSRGIIGCMGLCVGFFWATPLLAEDLNVIVFGGGWGPEGTQLSIEAHVQELARALRAQKPVVLFADGDPKTRSVQVQSPVLDQAGAILGTLFDRRDNLHVLYRPSRAGAHASASKKGLVDTLRSVVRGKKTVVFGAGHGAPAYDEQGASLELWGSDSRLEVQELAKTLDKLGLQQPLAMVLGHCHSGAFTDLMYEGGDSKKGLAKPTRCVHAAVPGDREAAGCTPDIEDPSARAYLSVIARALREKHRSDFNHDGTISLDEAHAFAKIYDQTIDVPVSSSEQWLAQELKNGAPKLKKASLKRLIRRARPSERAVLEQLLPAALRKSTPRQVEKKLAHLRDASEEVQKKMDERLEAWQKARRLLLDKTLARFPELVNPYHHESRRLLSSGIERVLGFVVQQNELAELRSIDSQLDLLAQERLTLTKKASRLERWLRTAQGVANEARFRSRRRRRKTKMLEALLECEALQLTLGSQKHSD